MNPSHVKSGVLKACDPAKSSMTELTRQCPSCEEGRPFYLCASTQLHLGEKTKWQCPDCTYSFVRIDDEVNTNKVSR